MNSALPHVVIIGGGFAGLYCARNLGRAPVRVTLVDARNFHLFQPLLYQVATASLSPADIAMPLRYVLRGQENTQVWLGTVTGIDPARRTVDLSGGGALHYDYLVLATGATHAYFGHDEWAERAPGLKTVDDATEIRRRFLFAFEAAEREGDPAARERLLTFAIVGAGPTGVELAGAMAEIARQVMPREFRSIDTKTARILLLEGGPRVLATYTEESSEKAQRQLEHLGVEVHTNALVTGITEESVIIGDHDIPAANVFWAAGVAASPLGTELGAPLDRAGRVIVEPDCTVPGHPDVFVLGDLARFEQDGAVVPGVAPAAIQMGKHAARAIRAEIAGEKRPVFVYRDKGNLAVIGRSRAVVDFGGVKLTGWLAWILWLFVHLLYLVGFRNRAVVLLSWGYAFLANRPSAALITNAEPSLSKAREPAST